MRYAVPLPDLDAAWSTRAGSALVEAAVLGEEAEDAEVVQVEGEDALVLPGPAPRVAAVVLGLVHARLPAPRDRPIRVYAEGPRGWQPVAAASRDPGLDGEGAAA